MVLFIKSNSCLFSINSQRTSSFSLPRATALRPSREQPHQQQRQQLDLHFSAGPNRSFAGPCAANVRIGFLLFLFLQTSRRFFAFDRSSAGRRWRRLSQGIIASLAHQRLVRRHCRRASDVDAAVGEAFDASSLGFDRHRLLEAVDKLSIFQRCVE